MAWGLSRVRGTCCLAHHVLSCQGVCTAVHSAQPECRPALARQLGAGGLPWWAVTLIVLGACAVFAAAVVGANLIVRAYQRRILGSSPPSACPRGWARAGGQTMVTWRKPLLSTHALPGAGLGARSNSGEALLAPLLLRIDGDDAGSVGAEDTSAVESEAEPGAPALCSVLHPAAAACPMRRCVIGGCRRQAAGAQAACLQLQQLRCCCGVQARGPARNPLRSGSR